MSEKKTKQDNENKIIIDGEDEILGRVASYAAKQALQGKQVNIINCEKILISGNRDFVLDNYLTMRKRPNVHFPSIPEQIMKRTIRGMINYKSGRGEPAFKKIRCYNKVPEDLKGKTIKLGNKNKDLMNLEELGEALKRGK